MIRGTGHEPCGFRTGRADFQPVVRIFEDSCGFIIGIFRQIVAKSAVFSPKRPFPAGSRPRAIRTTCRKSAHTIQNPHNRLSIRTICQKSRSIENPHNLSSCRQRTPPYNASRSSTILPRSGRGNSPDPGGSYFRTALHLPPKRVRPSVPDTHSNRPQNPSATTFEPQPALAPQGLRAGSRHVFCSVTLTLYVFVTIESCRPNPEGSATVFSLDIV